MRRSDRPFKSRRPEYQNGQFARFYLMDCRLFHDLILNKDKQKGLMAGTKL